MDARNPLIADDAQTDEEKLEKDRRLRKTGIKVGELPAEEIDDLSDDIRGDSKPLQASYDKLSHVVGLKNTVLI